VSSVERRETPPSGVFGPHWAQVNAHIRGVARRPPKDGHAAAGETVLRIRSTDIGRLDLRKQLSAEAVDGKIVLESTGRDPHFLLPEFEISETLSYEVCIDVECPEDNLVQVYYTTEDDPVFSARQSVLREMTQGRNVLCLQVPARGEERLHGPLRVDIGSVPGIFTLNDLFVKAVEK
jgi:hypothetical protein